MAQEGSFLRELQQGWLRFWRLSWWWKAPTIAVAALVVLGIGGAIAGGGDEEKSQSDVQGATDEPSTDEPTIALTETEEPLPATPTPEPEDTATPVPPQPTPILNRMNCDAIRGTPYRSEQERAWFLNNCSPPTPVPQPTSPPQPNPVGSFPDANGDGCHDSYVGNCLLPNASDYDCSGGSGNGPYYTGPVTVVGPDVFDLDRDGDGAGCE